MSQGGGKCEGVQVHGKPTQRFYVAVKEHKIEDDEHKALASFDSLGWNIHQRTLRVSKSSPEGIGKKPILESLDYY